MNTKLNLPNIQPMSALPPGPERLFLGAYGFEDRSLVWVKSQRSQQDILSKAILIRYLHPKGNNRVKELKQGLTSLGAKRVIDLPYDVSSPHDLERLINYDLSRDAGKVDEIIVDVSAMTKLLILLSLMSIRHFPGTVRLVYSEAEDYAPTQSEYEGYKTDMSMIAKFPSQGVESIVRAKGLSSIRMQGEPITLVAFTSFNEQLIRTVLGTLSPHRLVLINGKPPREDYAWREQATQEIHEKIISEYRTNNPKDAAGKILRVASTLYCNETVKQIDDIYKLFGSQERIICAATGSKMQTVGLFFSKILHPDIHIEYPTPDSYFVKGMSTGVRAVHEIVQPKFADFVQELNRSRIDRGERRTGSLEMERPLWEQEETNQVTFDSIAAMFQELRESLNLIIGNTTALKDGHLGDINEKQRETLEKIVYCSQTLLDPIEQQANKVTLDTMAAMSHELRTPLNAIIGFSEVLLERMFGELNEKQTEYVDDVLSSGRHLLSLINDILDLSKIEAGRMEFELTKFDLPSAIEYAFTLVQERATRHDIKLERVIDDRLREFVGDERKIKQILLNLLSNAVEFTPERGQIWVKAMRGESSVIISVADTGIGIPPADQKAIFEKFLQVGTTSAQKREGTGLGMTLTKKFVEMHGGTISVESQPGKGTTFTFTLPHSIHVH